MPFNHERLVKLRNDRGLTQGSISDLLRMSRSTYAQYEVGRRTPDDETLDMLATFFHVSVDYLLDRTNNPLPNGGDNLDEVWPEGIEALRRANEKLGPKSKKKMLNLINTWLQSEEDDE